MPFQELPLGLESSAGKVKATGKPQPQDGTASSVAGRAVRQCAARHCLKQFLPRRKDQIFCCKRCKVNEGCLRGYYRDKDRSRRTRARYLAKHGDRFKASRLAYRQRNATALKVRYKRYYMANRAKWQNHKLARRAREKATPQEMALIESFMRKEKSKQTHKCHWCKKTFRSSPHFDHVIALSKEGRHSLGNMCVSCADCNLKKAALKPSDFVASGQTFLSM